MRESVASMGTALRAEVLKGRRCAPRKIVLLAPLPFCLLGALAGGAGGGGAVGGFATYGWNYWYSLMLPVVVALVATSVANLDARSQLRSVLGLPLPPARTWWAKTIYALALVLGANLVVLAGSVVAGALGASVPTFANGLITALLLTAASAWMVPASMAFAVRFGTLAGIAIPAAVQVIAGVVLWAESWWFLVPPAAALRMVSPFMGVEPSGVPLAPGDALGVFGWQAVVGLALAVGAFCVLAAAGARWFARREAR